MANPGFPLTVGYALLGLLAGIMFVAVAEGNDQKRLVGYDPEHSLQASCAPSLAAVFTNRERLAVFLQKPDGRIAAQPIYRGGEISDLRCDPDSGQVIVTSDRSERRIYIAQARSDGHALVLAP